MIRMISSLVVENKFKNHKMRKNARGMDYNYSKESRMVRNPWKKQTTLCLDFQDYHLTTMGTIIWSLHKFFSKLEPEELVFVTGSF